MGTLVELAVQSRRIAPDRLRKRLSSMETFAPQASTAPVKAVPCEEFEVDADPCLLDVAVLLQELQEAGLVELEGEAA